MESNIKGKVAVITGAGGTLCSEMARELARQGAKVVVAGRGLENTKRVTEEIIASGGQAMQAVFDVTDINAMHEARKQVREEFGYCQILVNGAGGNMFPAITTVSRYSEEELGGGDEDLRGFFNLDMETFGRVAEINLMGTVIPCQVFGEAMVRAGGGSIVNIASMNSYRPLSRVGAYGAAKAGVRNFTQWLADYLAPAKVRVNAIAPGFFLNQNNSKRLLTPDGGLSPRGEQIVSHTPMARFGEAKELLGTLKWLVDDEASGFVTGVTIPVDGGFLACSGL
jgi:NAD(P)-dependent dehydrogenase (short-subunit alcohol dehydrogenase family)